MTYLNLNDVTLMALAFEAGVFTLVASLVAVAMVTAIAHMSDVNRVNKLELEELAQEEVIELEGVIECLEADVATLHEVLEGGRWRGTRGAGLFSLAGEAIVVAPVMELIDEVEYSDEVQSSPVEDVVPMGTGGALVVLSQRAQGLLGAAWGAALDAEAAATKAALVAAMVLMSIVLPAAEVVDAIMAAPEKVRELEAKVSELEAALVSSETRVRQEVLGKTRDLIECLEAGEAEEITTG